jgi:hypothetical protein
MGQVLEVQEHTKEKRVGEHLRTPHLPQMQGQRATTSVWPEFHLRGAGAPTQTLMLDAHQSWQTLSARRSLNASFFRGCLRWQPKPSGSLVC